MAQHFVLVCQIMTTDIDTVPKAQLYVIEGDNMKSETKGMPLPGSLIKNDQVTIFPEGALGYLLGPTLAATANAVLANYFNAYMSNVLNINRWASWFFAWIPVISVVFVVLGNILVGRLMDKNVTRAGKARPLILLSIPLSILGLIVLFVLSPYVNETMPEKQTAALILLAIGYILWFAVAYPMYSTPHAAVVSLSTRNSKDRGLLATISNACAMAAMGIASMVLPFFLRLLFVYDMNPAAGTPVMNAAGAVEYYTDASGAVIYDGLTSYNHWKIFVIALMITTVVGAVIEYLFTRERVTEENFTNASEEPKTARPVREQAKVCLHDRYWIIIMAFLFCFQMGGMIKNVSQLYFCQAMFPDASGNYTVAYGGQLQGTLAIVGAIPTALGMLIAVPLANKIGKAKAILCGAVLAVTGGVIGLIFPSNYPIVLVSFVIKALGSTPAMYLQLALLADVYDHQEALNGFRTDGFSMMIYGAIMAGMTGLATGIMNMVLSALSYSASNISSPAIRAAMPWLFIGGETICYAVIFSMFLFMNVERYSKLDHAAIRLDQNTGAEGETIADDEALQKFNEQRRKNGRTELKPGVQKR
ncbi:MAG: MFS transporter [Clostridia bacterium]|nr:MFS transporter [Clostridia bacterium]